MVGSPSRRSTPSGLRPLSPSSSVDDVATKSNVCTPPFENFRANVEDVGSTSDADDIEDASCLHSPPLFGVPGSFKAGQQPHTKRGSSATVTFQLPFMAQCNVDAFVEESTWSKSGGELRQRKLSQDEMTGPMGGSKDEGGMRYGLGLSQASADRKSNCSSDLGSLSGQLAVGWRRPTLYRCLENSQELKMALSFDKFRHKGSAK